MRSIDSPSIITLIHDDCIGETGIRESYPIQYRGFSARLQYSRQVMFSRRLIITFSLHRNNSARNRGYRRAVSVPLSPASGIYRGALGDCPEIGRRLPGIGADRRQLQPHGLVIVQPDNLVELSPVYVATSFSPSDILTPDLFQWVSAPTPHVANASVDDMAMVGARSGLFPPGFHSPVARRARPPASKRIMLRYPTPHRPQIAAQFGGIPLPLNCIRLPVTSCLLSVVARLVLFLRKSTCIGL